MTRSTGAPGAAPEQRCWHALAAPEALTALQSAAQGLTADEAARRLAEHGRNELPPPPKRSALRRFLLQFHNLLIYVLLIAGAVTLLLGHVTDAGVIVGVVLINAIVLRDGRRHEIDAAELVPGDIVLLASGDRFRPTCACCARRTCASTRRR